jgi:DNA-binding transcriptional MerR regulator
MARDGEKQRSHGRPPAERDGRHEYRIDELARLAGTTVRNVRAYQDRGLLPAPRRQGRVGIYGEAHLARLKLIGELLSRGYTLANIAELIAGWEQGRELSDLLGLESALIGNWSEEPGAAEVSAEVVDHLDPERARELLEAATRHGLIERDGDRIKIDNPRMLEGAAALVDAGVPVPEVVDLGVYLRGAVDDIAARYVELISEHLFDEDKEPISDADIRRLAELVRRLRPLARQVVDAELAIAVERRITTELGEHLSRLAPPHRDAGAG